MQRKEVLSGTSASDAIAAGDMLEQAPSQQIIFSHLKDIFEEELQRAGGMKVNLFTAQIKR